MWKKGKRKRERKKRKGRKEGKKSIINLVERQEVFQFTDKRSRSHMGTITYPET